MDSENSWQQQAHIDSLSCQPSIAQVLMRRQMVHNCPNWKQAPNAPWDRDRQSVESNGRHRCGSLMRREQHCGVPQRVDLTTRPQGYRPKVAQDLPVSKGRADERAVAGWFATTSQAPEQLSGGLLAPAFAGPCPAASRWNFQASQQDRIRLDQPATSLAVVTGHAEPRDRFVPGPHPL